MHARANGDQVLASRLHGPEDLRLDTVPDVVAGEGEVRVQVAHNGICGTDLHLYYLGTGRADPITLGHEFSGVIDSIGPGVTDIAPGTPVTVRPLLSCGRCDRCREGLAHLCMPPRILGCGVAEGGGLAEYCVARADMVFPLPDGVSLEQGALVEPLAVAYQGVLRGDVGPGTDTKLPIGYPLKDKDVLVLDDHRRELGYGEVGELAVKSRYISLGYWRDPERTRSVFLPDPAGSGARIYLTGDLGLRRADGCLVHVGREDFQVKIRGFRIDVGEIEIALRAIEAVADAVVVGRYDAAGTQRLVAYFVSMTHPPVTITKLRQNLARTLPDYMIPSAFVCMDALPQTPNGKTDRLRLPPPPRNRPELDSPFVPPGTKTETELSTIWSEVLGIDRLGINDNFFELGGDSLLATRIVTRVMKKFTADLPIRTLFDTPTIAQQAEQVLLTQTNAIGAENLAKILNEVESLSDEEIHHRLTTEQD